MSIGEFFPAETEISNGKNSNDENNGRAVRVLQQDEPNSVSVLVRVRPLSTVEHADPSVKSVVQCLNDGIVVHGAIHSTSSRFFGSRNAQPRPQYFKVDKVFHQHSTQIEVYAACRAIVAGALEGINGSILAYGATGAGKTHTMFGGSMSAAGVVYQAVQDLLEAKERMQEVEQKTVTIRCSFLEVYNEEVFDLLQPCGARGSRISLKVQDLGLDEADESISGVNLESLSVKGLTYGTPTTAEEFAKLVERGHTNRFVASTNANAHSSRSHAILTIEVKVRDKLDEVLGTVGRICFCDLAGSERAAGTSNSGIRLREGGNINRSLLALGAVVQALAQRKKYPKKNNFIPYRGSKLTRLLRDCLGGNCRTLMLFCVSPSSVQYEETINTMLFAMQAKEIQVAAKRHEFRVDSKEVAKSQEKIIEELRIELAYTRDELLRIGGGGSISFSYDPNSSINRVQFSPQASLVHLEPLSNDPMAFSSSVHGKEQILSILTPPPPPLPPLVVESEIRKESPEVSSPNQQEKEQEQQQQQQQQLELQQSAFTRASTRASVMAEGSEAYTELQNKLKRFSVEKENLYREMRETQEANSELDIKLRQHKWKLAHFLSSRRRSGVEDQEGETVTPVGVAGLRNTIKKMELEAAAQGGEMERLLKKMNEMDQTIANLREELLRERQHPLLELLLDNVKLRQSCTEAECLAAHYHQECRNIKNREEEYAQALSVCVSSIRRMLPFVSDALSVKLEAQLALMFANLPSLSTSDMIPELEKSMKTGNAPTNFLDSQVSWSSVEGMEARLKRMVKDRKNSKNVLTRRISQQRLGGIQTRVATSANKFNPSRNIRFPLPNNKVSKPRPEPFARSYTTTALRKPVVKEFPPTKKLIEPRSTSVTNGKKCVTFATSKSKNNNKNINPPHPQPFSFSASSPFSGGSGTAARAAARGGKFTNNNNINNNNSGPNSSTYTSLFTRSHTANEAMRESKGGVKQVGVIFQGGRSPTPPTLAGRHRAESHERIRKPRQINHVPFCSPSGVSTSNTSNTNTSSTTDTPPQKHPNNADLRERYDKLLSEVLQWNHGTTTAPAASRKKNATE